MELRIEKVLEKFKLYANEPMDGEDTRRDSLCQGLCEECVQWVQGQVVAEDEPGSAGEEDAGGEAGGGEIAGKEATEGGTAGGEASSEKVPEGLPALESYAASEAFYQLAVLDQAVLPQSLSSPEVKLQLGDRVGHAQRLRAEKRRACGTLLQEDGFYFGQI